MTTTTRDKLANGFVLGMLCVGAVGHAAFGVQWLAHPEAMARDLGIVLTNGDAPSLT
jgi:hypothetical protein